MKKLFVWCKQNIPFISAIFLLVFIPLYPKLPLVDVKNTWVYVRIEDVLVLFILSLWGILVARGRVTLKTPLTMPILLFWIAGAIATIHGILLIFPFLQAVYPNVAFLSFLRRMEYMSLFFVSYAAMKDTRYMPVTVITLAATILAVSFYGIGQKYLGFPAFLTMNEEYAKGTMIYLSKLSRIPSTFGGHYDLAAYLVLVLPVLVSMIFGFRKWSVRVFLSLSIIVGLVALFMTVSRISFFALVVALGLVLFMHMKKLILYSLPVVAVAALLFVSISSRVFNRFGSTIKAIDVVVDAKTGDPIGHTQTVPNTYFATKIIKQQYAQTIKNIYGFASPSASFVVPYQVLPEKVILLAEPDAPTGEDLPQGTGYINLSFAPVESKLGNFFYEPKPRAATSAAEVFIINGDFLLKKVFTYDLSFTTRFQGEWPKAMVAFMRNILVGSGYGSVGLAVDNSYLRMLAEVGLVGFLSFFGIFIAIGIYIANVLPTVDSKPVRSFMIGIVAGFVGLAVNALFIDVFEASKVAFTMWLLAGMSLGVLKLYERKAVNMYREFQRIITSTPAIAAGLLLITVLLYSPMTRNNFVGDDFTWFRWAADCNSHSVSGACPINAGTIFRYFTQSQGFFYRPGTKVYFLVMYTVFWLNQTAYHTVSLALHGIVVLLVFFLTKKLLKNSLLAAAAGFFFLIMSGYSEAVHWVSATGFLFSASFTLLSLLSFIAWEESSKKGYGIATGVCVIFSLLFHEVGIVSPIILLLYRSIFSRSVSLGRLWTDATSKLIFLPLPLYLLIRFLSGSHWLSGDYNYNIFRLPFNITGNSFGYMLLALVGSLSQPVYQLVRNGFKVHMVFAAIVMLGAGAGIVWAIRACRGCMQKRDRSFVLFGILFFLVALLPFLGLGNISSRYSYLSSVGVVFVLVIAVKYLHAFLLQSGRAIAAAGTIIVICVFVLLHIIQQQQITADWYQAGEISRRFIVSMGGVYEDSWALAPVELHFVNVPIRHGEAWVFPVGMPDALWLIYRNPNARIFTWPTLPEAFAAVKAGEKTQKVFEFDGSGKVTERIKPPDTQ